MGGSHTEDHNRLRFILRFIILGIYHFGGFLTFECPILGAMGCVPS